MFFKAIFAISGTVAAQAEDFASTADKAALAAPNYALGAAYGRSSETPTTLTFGPIHKDTDEPVAADASWHIGSITKSFTASTVMRLVERGDLSLDAPIADFLPADRESMHVDWQALTLRQLLSHTSGLPANAPKSAFHIRSADDLHTVRRDVLAAMWDEPLSNDPGTYTYSNLGYVLAGFVAEEVTDLSWEDLVRREIADPLNLTSLGYGAPTAPGSAWGHRESFFIKRPVPPDAEITDNPPWLGPAGTIRLTLADLIRWGQAHMAACQGDRPDFLSAESCREMQKVVAEDYGLGWVIVGSETDTAHIWHNGSNSMWYALLLIAPEENLVLAAVTNVFDAKRIDKLVHDLHQAMKTARDP